MITNLLSATVWIANTAAGNNGSMLHMIFWYTFQATAGLALVNFIFQFLAWNSYGTMADVWKNWDGSTIGSSKYKAHATTVANGGDWDPVLAAGMGKNTTDFVSTKTKILWRDVATPTIDAADQ